MTAYVHGDLNHNFHDHLTGLNRSIQEAAIAVDNERQARRPVTQGNKLFSETIAAVVTTDVIATKGAPVARRERRLRQNESLPAETVLVRLSK
jgi:hypothetical protein